MLKRTAPPWCMALLSGRRGHEQHHLSVIRGTRGPGERRNRRARTQWIAAAAVNLPCHVA